MIKMKTREASINYGKTKKRNLEQKQDEIEKSIKILEEQIANTHANDSQKLWPELEKKRFELEAIIEYQTKGAILRSKSQWYNEGEKNSKYFLNLEKRHCRQNTITQLKINDMDVIQSDKEILHECENFYKNLYSSKMQLNNSSKDFFPQARQVLSNENLYFCEGPLKSKECLEALKSMASEKSPGTDGLPSEFYKVFWEEIEESLTSALNFSFEIGQLPISQRRGIIKLIPKKDADPNLIKNWRPLTLLNCDYKIASKAIANRIKTVLPELISDDQSGFIKNRCISDNIRTLDSVIQYTANKNIPGLLLFLDFEKAFDTLEWSFIEKSLQHFGFGPSLSKWVRLFYCKTESCILNNGWTSNFFELSRGVRQGCPLSPYLFILSVEILAEAIRNKREITGIKIQDTEFKLSQYADDTTLSLDGSEESFKASLTLIEAFGKMSGLKQGGLEALPIMHCE